MGKLLSQSVALGTFLEQMGKVVALLPSSDIVVSIWALAFEQIPVFHAADERDTQNSPHAPLCLCRCWFRVPCVQRRLQC